MEWINVNDELPQHGVPVLCIMQINPSGKNKYRTITGVCYNGEWRHSDGSQTWFEISHWMPLPEPPKC